MRYVALLRGINVGGKNKLPMKDLTALFAAAECRDVQTYIQSGNVVFESSASAGKSLPSVIARGIAKRFGLDVPVVLRTATELREVVRRSPVRGAAVEHLHVAFLSAEPDSARVASLDPARSPPDTWHVVGREIYLHLPNGAGKTKLTNAYLDARLGAVSTMRNWRTVLALDEMASGAV